MKTMTQQTARRRRGREIRKARRLERTQYQQALGTLERLRRSWAAIGRGYQAFWAAIARGVQDFWTTLRVAFQRVLPQLPLPPRAGGGARRQLPSGRDR